MGRVVFLGAPSFLFILHTYLILKQNNMSSSGGGGGGEIDPEVDPVTLVSLTMRGRSSHGLVSSRDAG